MKRPDALYKAIWKKDILKNKKNKIQKRAEAKKQLIKMKTENGLTDLELVLFLLEELLLGLG
jgi:hypothetical protein